MLMKHSRFKQGGALLAVVALSIVGWSKVSAQTSLSAEGAVQAALMNNRDLKAARFEIQKAKARLQQSGLWPNPGFEFEGISDFAFANEGQGAFALGLSQLFPLTGRLGLSRQVKRIEVAEAMREIRNRERLLIAQVQQAYVEVVATHQQASRLADMKKNVAATRDLAEKRLAAGQGSAAEPALVLVEETSLMREEQMAKMTAELKLTELRGLLGLEANAPLRLTESLQDMVAKLEKNTNAPDKISRPDADLAVIGIDRTAVEVRLARAEAWEGVTLTVRYENEHSLDEPEGMGTDQFLGIRVSFPLPLWDQQKGAVAEKRAARSEAEARLSAIELEIRNAAAVARKRATLLKQQRGNFSSTRDPLQNAEKTLTTAYSEGRADLRDVLTVRREMYGLDLQSSDLLKEQAFALVELQSALGSHPEMSRPYLEAAEKTKKSAKK